MQQHHPVPSHLEAFWQRFAASRGGVDPTRFHEAFAFGDSEPLARELAALVLHGAKRATAGSVWSFERRGLRLPAPGDLSIVTTWSGEPLCVIETIEAVVRPFDEVPADFAAAEAEGDGSLASWREGHRRYFTRECERGGRTFSEDMPVLCERFEVVYRAPASATLGA
ncbi:ASCH domain-containing protein [Piscinibacter gummiphilus]|uniref:ASCH domain-containing protein n=2 Tax=Piscinibacter gummiphilus TaxID=946333 RepID=A0A1W6LDD9_9BURK|nr:ASCH domain-containing protein [Piscinibacter gummiphilus]ATU66959.1 ASCH domain-containing protein [Piscinibacter gummiphilus]